MPQTEEQLFVITASNPDAQRHIGKSIADSIDPALCTQHFDSAVLEDVRQKSADGKFYAWGALPGERNQPNWSAMQAGDYVLVYQVKHYTYWTRVISKHRNATFAEALWGRDPEGRTWEFMYFLQPPVPLQCPAQKTADVLPATYQGFSRRHENFWHWRDWRHRGRTRGWEGDQDVPSYLQRLSASTAAQALDERG